MRIAALLSLTLTSVVGSGACIDERAFTAEERERLAGFRLPVKLPASPSNRFAEDSKAAILGKKWFFDTRFSGALGPPNDGVTHGSLGVAGVTGKVSCWSCHDLTGGGADRRSRPAATSLGAGYSVRNAPSTINAAYANVGEGGWVFWDGRKDSMWSHAVSPLENPLEQNGSRLQLAHAIFDHYKLDYEAVFGPLPDLSDAARFPATGKPGDLGFDNMAAPDRTAVNRIAANFGKALEAYQRRLTSLGFAPSPFDRALAGDDAAMSPEAIRGARLFIGKAACDECHRGPMLSDRKFHNVGAPQDGEHVLLVDRGRFDGVAAVKADIFNRAGAYSDQQDDAHLKNLTTVDADLGAFRTPTLRNVARTAPYMHNGVYKDLWEVVNHYNFGGATAGYAGTRDVAMSPLLLDDQELSDLVEFLRALSDADALVSPEFPEGLLEAPVLPR
jgi:cytochrome c peroxidase